ncbi:2770_t:CDS:2, partial [Gigaspora rosea]
IRARSFSPESDINAKRLKREKEYNDTVARGLEANSPSVGSKPPEFFRNQRSCPILNGRPFENTGPPITLYHIIFSQFLGDLSNANIEIPSDFLLWIDDLIYAATDSYVEEEDRNQKMRIMFLDKLGTVSVIEYGQGRMKCKSDGVFTSTTNIDLITAYLGIFKGKNEIGTGGSDPTIQGAIYFRDYWSQSNNAAALRPLSSPSQAHQRFFPYIREFPSNEGRVPFTYISELSDDYTRTIWKAKTDDNRMIVVKFAAKYNFEAHNLCAIQDYAPKLLYCSNDEEAKTLGGLKMVIMEYVDSTSLGQKHWINPVLWETIFNDVEAAIQLLHDNNFVFADLRAPNILIINATQHAMLIDFDWCGKHDVD